MLKARQAANPRRLLFKKIFVAESDNVLFDEVVDIGDAQGKFLPGSSYRL